METEANRPIRQSTLGAASLACSLVSVLASSLVFVVRVVPEKDPGYYLFLIEYVLLRFYVLRFAAFAGCGYGIVLGITGLAKKERQKGLAIAGLVLGVLALGPVVAVLLDTWARLH